MSKSLILGLFFSLAIMVTSCGSSKEESQKKIQELEAKLLDANGNPKDEVSAYNLQVEYDSYAERFPEDAKAPEYLFKAATISINLKWGESAIKILDKFVTKFPDNTKTPEAMFLKGYVYDNVVNDDAKAGEVYKAFIAKYPNHTYAKDAEALIPMLGKTDEEMIREFEKMNSDTTRKDTAKASV
jgi:outer membrane protein assembly factor BamD (BamD/ComL family)